MPPYRKDSQKLDAVHNYDDALMQSIPHEPDLTTRPIRELAGWLNQQLQDQRNGIVKLRRKRAFSPFE